MPKTKSKAATANVQAVVGSDESEVKRTAAELATKLTPPDAGDFGLEVIDGVVDNADQAASRIRSTIEALQTLPFFGGGKLVWATSAQNSGEHRLPACTFRQPAEKALRLLSSASCRPLQAGSLRSPDHRIRLQEW